MSTRATKEREQDQERDQALFGVTLKNGQNCTVGGTDREHRQAAAAVGNVLAMPRNSRNPSGPKALSTFQR